MLPDLTDSLASVEEGDDFQPAAAGGADQGGDFVDFLDQPGPTPAAFPAEVFAVGIVVLGTRPG
jgi:hypothetical protein